MAKNAQDQGMTVTYFVEMLMPVELPLTTAGHSKEEIEAAVLQQIASDPEMLAVTRCSIETIDQGGRTLASSFDGDEEETEGIEEELPPVVRIR